MGTNVARSYKRRVATRAFAHPWKYISRCEWRHQPPPAPRDVSYRGWWWHHPTLKMCPIIRGGWFRHPPLETDL